MATCFKLPYNFRSLNGQTWVLKKRSEVERLVLVKYKKEDRNVVVKKMNGESMETKRRFQEKAGLLRSVKGHRIVSRSDTTSLGNMTFYHSHSVF